MSGRRRSEGIVLKWNGFGSGQQGTDDTALTRTRKNTTKNNGLI